VWALPIQQATSGTIIKFLYHYIVTFVGAPAELITDKGRNLISEEMQTYLNQNNIKHLETSPWHPSTNGMVERMHGMLNHGITALCVTNRERWDEYVDEVVFGIRVRTHNVTKRSPFYLLFGVDPRIPGDVMPPVSTLEPLDEVESRLLREEWTNRELQDLGVARGQAFIRTQAQRESLNTNTKDFYFQLDDWVKIKNHGKLKFQFSWKGPFIVHGYGYYPTYWLRKPNGEFLKSVINQANMAPWTARISDNEDFFYGFAEDRNYTSGAFPEEENDVASSDDLDSEEGLG
jgi:hypothetical protein